jgi:hypothetical protein
MLCMRSFCPQIAPKARSSPAQHPERVQIQRRDREEPGDDPRDTPRPHQCSLPNSRAAVASAAVRPSLVRKSRQFWRYHPAVPNTASIMCSNSVSLSQDATVLECDHVIFGGGLPYAIGFLPYLCNTRLMPSFRRSCRSLSSASAMLLRSACATDRDRSSGRACLACLAWRPHCKPSPACASPVPSPSRSRCSVLAWTRSTS